MNLITRSLTCLHCETDPLAMRSPQASWISVSNVLTSSGANIQVSLDAHEPTINAHSLTYLQAPEDLKRVRSTANQDDRVIDGA